jgi:hypothetical protein
VLRYEIEELAGKTEIEEAGSLAKEDVTLFGTPPFAA